MFYIPYGSYGLAVNQGKKNTLVLTKISRKTLRYSLKQKFSKFLALLTGVDGYLNVNRTAKNMLVLTN